MQGFGVSNLVSNPSFVTSVIVGAGAYPVTVCSLVILLWKMGLVLIGSQHKESKRDHVGDST